MKRIIHEIKELDIAYPYYLFQIDNRPKKIYVVGNLEILRNDCVAIVGTRKCSKVGLKHAYNLAYKTARQNKTIVSGLALGVDSSAHKGAINAGGKTIAVLAHGFSTIYPKENIKLATEIINSGGAIITEYNFYDKPYPENFKKRNRIISGLSKDVYVIEAGLDSGAMITANYALEQNRNIYVLPGKINDKNYYGSNKLIRQGADIALY